MVLDLIEDSYDLVVSSLSKARQRKLGWTAGPGAVSARTP